MTRYFLRKIKRLSFGDIEEAVLITSIDGEQNKVFSDELLLECKEISEQKAIELCGSEAIIGPVETKENGNEKKNEHDI